MITPHTDTIQSETVTYTDRKGRAQSWQRQTIEVTIRGNRRRVNCSVTMGGTSEDPKLIAVTVCGLAVRFRTGSKVWPGSAVFWSQTGTINNLRPNIDKFNGQFCSLLGFFEDYEDSKNRSQHNAVA